MTKLYSISEIAKRLDVSRQYVWFLIQTRKLRAQKVGNVYVVEKKELEQFLEQKWRESNVREK